ncbi:hypothetical protein [Amycolatopsis sp. NPDC059657]|uniref:hypothetical protein n=1 Tax=Amycolatopsis sp. NPDC059657 TaxID=3346899 RepID=UPI00366BA5E0
MKRTVTTMMATVGLGLGLAPVALAATAPSLEVYPAEVRPGAVFGTGIKGGCDHFSAVTSPGFTAPVSLVAVGGDRNNLWGNGNAVTTPGTYTATATCDGKKLSTRFTVLPHPAPSWWLNPTEVQPGGEITAGSDTINACPGGPAGPVTSPGFAAPLEFTMGGNFGRISGKTTVTTVPGKYTATLKCKGTPVTGTLQFTVLGTPPTPRPTKTTAPPATKKQPQVVVPKGAPETGGGPN